MLLFARYVMRGVRVRMAPPERLEKSGRSGENTRGGTPVREPEAQATCVAAVSASTAMIACGPDVAVFVCTATVVPVSTW